MMETDLVQMLVMVEQEAVCSMMSMRTMATLQPWRVLQLPDPGRASEKGGVYLLSV